MYRVLLPVDPDANRAKSAAEAVVSLPCSGEEVEVIVLSVFEKREIKDMDGGRVSSEALFEQSDPPESLIETAEFLETRDIETTIRREHGKPAQVILETATEEDVDNIVMSGRKRSPIGKVMFGSVTQSVILDSPVPVTIVEAA